MAGLPEVPARHALCWFAGLSLQGNGDEQQPAHLGKAALLLT